jgi:hypothetical protein
MRSLTQSADGNFPFRNLTHLLLPHSPTAVPLPTDIRMAKPGYLSLLPGHYSPVTEVLIYGTGIRNRRNSLKTLDGDHV